MCVCQSVHCLCGSGDQASGVHRMVIWQIDRCAEPCKPLTLVPIGVEIRWQIAKYDHAKPWHGGVMAW